MSDHTKILLWGPSLYPALHDRDLKDGYRWRMCVPYGRDACHFAARIPGEAACEAELRAFMVYYPGAEVLHTTG